MKSARFLLVTALMFFPGVPLVSYAGDPVSIQLDMTLKEGFDPMKPVCGTEEILEVGQGQTVEVCYEVTNTGSTPLNFHDLEDSVFGTILSEFPYMLDPGASVFVTVEHIATASTTFNGTWTAYNQVDGPIDVAIGMDSASLTVVPPSIELQMTLSEGFDPKNPVCGTVDNLEVGEGASVEVCYEVTNTGMTPFNFHDLEDSVFGTILSEFPFTLNPGASAFLTLEYVANAPATFNGTWTAYNNVIEGPVDVAISMDSASLTVVPPSIELQMTLSEGFDPKNPVCGATDNLVVGEGASVEVCYEVTNTGMTPLNFHDLEDSVFGTILSEFPFMLNPGASAFLTLEYVANASATFNGTWTAYNQVEGPINVAVGMDSASLTVVPPSIDLEVTLSEGYDPMNPVCGSSDALTVDRFVSVEVCYEVTNTGMTPLNLHDLEDSVFGTILSGFPFTLNPGASAFLTQEYVANDSATFNATWTAYNEGPTNEASDSDSAELTVNLPPRATFAVEKLFDDDNPAEVEVTISCNTGLPLEQSTLISQGDGVIFVVTDFDDGALDCTITETAGADGYDTSYFDGAVGSPDGCTYESVLWTEAFSCEINNSLLPVDVEVTKTWIDDNPQFVSPYVAEAVYACVNERFGEAEGELFFNGNPDTRSFSVFPHWNGTTTCTVIETPIEGGVEFNDDDCEGLTVTPGNGASCEIVNTRLYAGIPTLSQYGLALLAMLFLAIGLVSVRRI